MELQIPLYHSALRPENVPAHLQKRRISSSGSNYHSSPGSPDGSPAITSGSPKNTLVACATTPPQRTGNTSRNAPSIQAGTR